MITTGIWYKLLEFTILLGPNSHLANIWWISVKIELNSVKIKQLTTQKKLEILEA